MQRGAKAQRMQRGAKGTKKVQKPAPRCSINFFCADLGAAPVNVVYASRNASRWQLTTNRYLICDSCGVAEAGDVFFASLLPGKSCFSGKRNLNKGGGPGVRLRI